MNDRKSIINNQKIDCRVVIKKWCLKMEKDG